MSLGAALLACPVCGSAKSDAARQAILEMTFVMSGLALLLIAALAILAVRHYRAVIRRDAELERAGSFVDSERKEREPVSC